MVKDDALKNSGLVLDVGIDIEDVKRFKNLKDTDTFIRNNFTSQEISYCFYKTRPELHLAGIFCVKEALMKTIGLKEKKSMKQIEVFHDADGKPSVRVKISGSGFMVSISHTATSAIAVVIRVGK